MVPHEHGRAGGAAHQLVRLVRAVRGRVEVDIRCEPAFDYGRSRTEVDIVEGAGAFFSSPAGQLVLRSTVSLVADGGAGGGGPAAVARPVLEEGETLALSLSRRGSPRPLDMVEVDALLATTLAYWQRWVRRSRYSGRYREMVERSALTLKLLVAPADRGPGRGAHDLAARGDRRHPQLGLPVHLGPRRGVHRLRADAPGLHRRGGGVHVVAGGPLPRRPRPAPGCRSSTASTAVPRHPS